MDNVFHAKITQAERVDGDLIVTFDDGRSAIYTAELLLSILNQPGSQLLDPDLIADE